MLYALGVIKMNFHKSLSPRFTSLLINHNFKHNKLSRIAAALLFFFFFTYSPTRIQEPAYARNTTKMKVIIYKWLICRTHARGQWASSIRIMRQSTDQEYIVIRIEWTVEAVAFRKPSEWAFVKPKVFMAMGNHLPQCERRTRIQWKHNISYIHTWPHIDL